MANETMRGALTFLGFAIGVLSVFYFAFEYIFAVSAWSKLVALIAFGLSFAYLGVYLESTSVGRPFFSGDRLRWLRPANVLYLLALLAGVTAEIVFLGVDDVARPLKILVSLVIAVGIIVWVARTQQGRRASGERATPRPGRSKSRT